MNCCYPESGGGPIWRVERGQDVSTPQSLRFRSRADDENKSRWAVEAEGACVQLKLSQESVEPFHLPLPTADSSIIIREAAGLRPLGQLLTDTNHLRRD